MWQRNSTSGSLLFSLWRLPGIAICRVSIRTWLTSPNWKCEGFPVEHFAVWLCTGKHRRSRYYQYTRARFETYLCNSGGSARFSIRNSSAKCFSVARSGKMRQNANQKEKNTRHTHCSVAEPNRVIWQWSNSSCTQPDAGKTWKWAQLKRHRLDSGVDCDKSERIPQQRMLCSRSTRSSFVIASHNSNGKMGARGGEKLQNSARDQTKFGKNRGQKQEAKYKLLLVNKTRLDTVPSPWPPSPPRLLPP